MRREDIVGKKIAEESTIFKFALGGRVPSVTIYLLTGPLHSLLLFVNWETTLLSFGDQHDKHLVTSTSSVRKPLGISPQR